jgi:histidinol-phosphatase (PHP family)
MEVDFIPEKHERIQVLLQGYPWDFLIGSVHQVDGIQFERNRGWSRPEGEALWLRYFALLREAIYTGSFSLISHPVRMGAVNPHLPQTLDEELEQLAAEATRANIALEINGYDVLSYPALVQRLAKACVLHQTPISIGSDAHNPKEVAQAHQQTESILREAGIKKVRIWRARIPQEYEV